MNSTLKHALLGFLFGTIGLFALSAVSLMSQIAEAISTPFLLPGRILADMFVGESGSDLDVALLTLGNGTLYALLFVWIGKLKRYSKQSQKEEETRSPDA